MVMNFWNGELVGNPLARFSRPVGDSDDLYLVLLCETRNMQGSGVAAGSDQANADLRFRHEAAHLSVDGAYQSTAGLVRVRHIFCYGSDGAAARHSTACTNLEPLSAPLLAAAPLLTVSWHSVGSQHSLGFIELNAGS